MGNPQDPDLSETQPHPDSRPTSAADSAKAALRIRNVRLFIGFRVFFNARFYYPVFTIMFLDFGLSVTQFALLNVVWALTIVVLEVPSGAMADIIGRKKLLNVTGVLMVAEMALLGFAPRTDPNLLFAIFMVNRILSGTAEAAASGADEALAYDALVRAGLSSHWGQVLEKQMRYQSVAYIFAMSLGAAVYDPQLMQAVADKIGWGIYFTQDITLRIPIWLTLVMALITMAITMSFEEIRASLPGSDKGAHDENAHWFNDISQAFNLTFKAGRWILATPFAVIIITAGVIFDSTARMVSTLVSQYYRLIELPEATFGLIGSATALLGFFIPRLALKLSEQKSPATNFFITAAVLLAGFIGMTFFWPYVGLIPALVRSSAMYLTSFFVSRYLNQITPSEQRATVLSFKGLFFNLAYAGVGMTYSLMLFLKRPSIQAENPDLNSMALENLVFEQTFVAFPLCLIAVLIPWIIYARRRMPPTS